MDKKLVAFFIVLLIITSTVVAQANNKKMNYALIMSVSPTINKALSEIYKDSSEGVPLWAGWEAEILEIDELFGVGGSYDVTVKVHPYYGAHIGEGIDEIKIRVESSGQKMISYKHLHDV